MIRKIMISSIIFLVSIFFNSALLDAQYYEEQTELISLDLKGMDIRDVLKILSQKSGLNIVADSNVKGKVALYIKDVTPMDALDIIVTTNGLAYEQDGTLIRVMRDTDYERLYGRRFEDNTVTEIVKLDYADAFNVSKAIIKMKSRIGKIIPDGASNTIVLIDNPKNVEEMKNAIGEMDVFLDTEVFSLDYAKAELIKDKVEKMLSENIGSLRFDERTNRIIVRDTPKRIEEIRKVIEAFDEKTREVVIDASIIKVTLSDKYSYGIDWADIAKLGDITLTGNTNLTTSLSNTTPNTLTIATTQNYTTVISLLKSFGETDVLSRPRITVADRAEARILVGAKEVYVTSEVTTTTGGTYHTTDNVQFVDVGVRLSVTPEINRAGYIKMKIKPEVSDTDATKTVTLTNPDGSTRSIIPYVTTSEAETTLLVKDNTTIILGGLMKDTITEYNDKVPFLGDLPLLGNLFSTHGKSKEKTELVIFLTPRIIECDRMDKETKELIDKWRKKEEGAEIERPTSKKFEIPKLKGLKRGEFKERLKSEQPPKPEKAILRNQVDRPGRKALSGQRKKVAPVKKTVYERYYLMVRREINNFAKRQDVGGLKGKVELQFTLDNEGFLVRGPIVLNKPDLTLVRAAVNCVKEVIPFPPFPEAMGREEAEFYVVVSY